MQLALLSGAIPRTCARGPKVRLQRGKWKFGCTGLIDTRLFLAVSFHPLAQEIERIIPITHDQEFELEYAAIVYVDFAERSDERFITINAEKVA